MKKLLSLRQGLDSGIWTAPHPLNPRIFWNDGANVYFRNGAVQKMDGWTVACSITATATPCRGLGQLLDATTRKLAIGTKDGLYIWDETTMVQAGSGYAGTLTETTVRAATEWSIESWGQWFFATNGVDRPQVWKGTGTSFTAVANITGASFSTAEIFCRLGPHLIAMATNNGIGHIAWSHSDEPEEWTATAANAAGSLWVRDVESEIIAAVPMADRIAMYTKEQMFLLNYVGSPNYFGYSPALKGIGAVSKNSVVCVDRLNFGLGRQGFFMTDGSRFEWIDDPAVRTWFFNRVNWTQRSKINAYHDEDAQQVIWYYPLSSTVECSQGIGFDYQRRVWSLYDHGRTASIEREAFQYPITADEISHIFYHHSGYDAGSTLSALAAFAESGPLDLGDQDAQKVVFGVKAAVSGVAGSGLKCQIGGKERLSDSITWGATLTVGAGHDMVKCDPPVTGRWIHVRLLSSDKETGWSVAGLDLYGESFGSFV
jgi:hypothetical protein